MNKIGITLSFSAVIALLSSPMAFANEKKCRLVGPEWVWFGDHAVSSITYYVISSSEVTYEIGTGVSYRGKPRGRKIKGAGQTKVKAYGIGAIKVRKTTLGSPAKVCVSSKLTEAIQIFKYDL